MLAPARAIGIYEGGLVPVDAGSVLYRFRAERIVVATGALEQPLVFPGNDLVGVMLPEAVRRLVDEWSLKPGERAVVVSADDAGWRSPTSSSAAGIEVVGSIDLRSAQPRRSPRTGAAAGCGGVVVDGRELDCDLLVMSGGRQPAYSLLAQAGARDRVRRGPRDLRAHRACRRASRRSARSPASVEPAAVPAASYNGADAAGTSASSASARTSPTKDLKRAIAEGFDSIELAKRYTTVTMGPCQGRLCHVPSIRALRSRARDGRGSDRHDDRAAALGAGLAGPARRPAARARQAHVDPPPPRGGRRDDDVDGRLAPRRTPTATPQAEAQNVHDASALIDVSTLGKLLVHGPGRRARSSSASTRTASAT